MPRQARLDSPGTLHHVMIRGIEGRNIVDDDQDGEISCTGWVRSLLLAAQPYLPGP